MGQFASAWLSGQVFRIRLFLGMGGVVLACGGAWFLYSNSAHSMNGEHTSALLTERIEQCKAEYQRRGESRRKEDMPCSQAEAFRALVGDKKVKVEKKTFVLLRFSLSDGTQHAAKVEEYTAGARSVPVGSRLAVVFDPANPSDVRAELTRSSVSMNLLVIGAGLAALLLAFIGPVLRIALGAFGGRSPAAHDPAQPAGAAWGDAALDRALAARTAQAAARPRTVERAADSRARSSVAGPRRQFGVRT